MTEDDVTALLARALEVVKPVVDAWAALSDEAKERILLAINPDDIHDAYLGDEEA